MLAEALRQQGVDAAAADYWLAYRLSMLFDLQPTVVPLAAGQDREPLERQRFDTGHTTALLFHPSEQRSTPQPYLQSLTAQHANVTVQNIAGFTVLIVKH